MGTNVRMTTRFGRKYWPFTSYHARDLSLPATPSTATHSGRAVVSTREEAAASVAAWVPFAVASPCAPCWPARGSRSAFQPAFPPTSPSSVPASRPAPRSTRSTRASLAQGSRRVRARGPAPHAGRQERNPPRGRRKRARRAPPAPASAGCGSSAATCATPSFAAERDGLARARPPHLHHGDFDAYSGPFRLRAAAAAAPRPLATRALDPVRREHARSTAASAAPDPSACRATTQRRSPRHSTPLNARRFRLHSAAGPWRLR